jgi:hypothetical protein
MEKEAVSFKDLGNKIKDFFSFDVKDIDFKLDDPAVVDIKQDQVDQEEKEEETKEQQGIPRQPKFVEPNEQVPVAEPVLETGEVQVNQYKIVVPAELQARLGDPAVDHSYSALIYLESLGYQTFTFNINPAHSKTDICDDIVANNPWTLSGVLRWSESNNFKPHWTPKNKFRKTFPVAPLFQLSHPNCGCYLTVHPPTSADQIPDSAPGLHMWDDPERIKQEKELLLPKLPDVNVDRYTLAPAMFETLSPIGELNQEMSSQPFKTQEV